QTASRLVPNRATQMSTRSAHSRFSGPISRLDPLLIFGNEITHQVLRGPEIGDQQAGQDRWERDQSLKRSCSKNSECSDGGNTALRGPNSAGGIVHQEQNLRLALGQQNRGALTGIELFQRRIFRRWSWLHVEPVRWCRSPASDCFGRAFIGQ